MPESFRMDDEQLAALERGVVAVTDGLPGHYFEEIRRAVVTRADGLAYHGMDGDKAVRRALAELGEPGSARNFLRRVEAGGTPALRLRSRRPRRLLLAFAALLAILGLLRWFVIGWYQLPEGQISMAPTLIPGVEGGDAVVLANLLAYRTGEPERGDLAVFQAPGEVGTFVKRVMGLPGESIAIREGDLFINDERLVKERPLLDRMAVRMSGFLKSGAQYVQEHPAHTGFPLPDRSMEVRQTIAGDVILEGTITLAGLEDFVTISLRAGKTLRHHVVFNAKGFGAGVFDGNRAVVRGAPCRLTPGTPTRFWLTTADRMLRLELDGREVARAPLDTPPDGLRAEFDVTGDVTLEDLSIARDVVYTTWPGASDRWRLGKSYFMLGDNSAKSKDSRSLGAISRHAVEGRVWLVAWPLSRARRVH